MWAYRNDKVTIIMLIVESIRRDNVNLSALYLHFSAYDKMTVWCCELLNTEHELFIVGTRDDEEAYEEVHDYENQTGFLISSWTWWTIPQSAAGSGSIKTQHLASTAQNQYSLCDDKRIPSVQLTKVLRNSTQITDLVVKVRDINNRFYKVPASAASVGNNISRW